MFTAIFALFSIGLVGCKKNGVGRASKDASLIFLRESKKDEGNMLQQEARFADLYIPVEAFPLSNFISDNSYAYRYEGFLETLIKYYDKEMEWLGWECKDRFQSHQETLLIFEKPHKKCAVSIRIKNEKEQAVYILLTPLVMTQE